MVGGYASAEDLFEAARAAARELGRDRAALERLSSRRVGGSSPIAGARGSGGDVNRTAASDAYMDYEGRVRDRMREDERLLELASAIAYGRGRAGGVAAILGGAYADALYWRYVAAETWERVAEMCHVGRTTAVRYCAVALETVDAVGLEAAVAGTGSAES